MKHQSVKQSSLFKIEDTRVVRTKRHCPRCGEGTFLAEHKDRFTCGACKYTEFKKAQ